MTEPSSPNSPAPPTGFAVAERVCVLTGAGVSAESGVPTFRASDGLWEGHRIEDVASPEGFERDPRLVWKFYNARRANVKTVKPNPGHHALAATGRALGRPLHARHPERRWPAPRRRQPGTCWRFTAACTARAVSAARRSRIAGWSRSARRRSASAVRGCGRTSSGSARRCRPTSGRPPPTAAYECDVLLVVGTSAVVHPAASLIPIAKRGGVCREGDRDQPDADRGERASPTSGCTARPAWCCRRLVEKLG